MAYCKLRSSPGDLYSFGHQLCLDEEIDTQYAVDGFFHLQTDGSL